MSTSPLPDLGETTLVAVVPALVEARLGPTVVGSLVLLKGGYSRRMWAVDVRGADDRAHQLVLCTDAPNGVVRPGEQALDRQAEGRLLHALHDQGVAVPDAVAWGGADGPLGCPFVVMERVAGATAVGPLVRDQRFTHRRSELGAQMADILVSVHRARVPVGLLEVPSEDCASNETRRWIHAVGDTRGASAEALDDAMAWLVANPPPVADRPVLVHGDFRTGNLMYDDTGFVAVLDWEMAHLGDPLEDVAWAQLICWRLGTGRVGGLVDDETWIKSYEDRSGVQIERSALRFWEILGVVKMCVLAHRAIAITNEPRERDLLIRLRVDLLDDLASRLLR